MDCQEFSKDMKAFLFLIIKKILIKNGFSNHYAPWYANMLVEDLFDRNFSLKNKVWAYKRGFRSSKVDQYGLSESNYKNYLPEYKYYQLHPINGQFSHWIDDKLTIRYLLEPFKQYLPKYYFHLGQGEIICLPDLPFNTTATIDNIISLLDNKEELTAKLLNASGGHGFIKLETKNGYYLVNNKIFTQDQFSNFLLKWKGQANDGYLITEFVHPSKQFKRIWDKSTNTIRVSTMRNVNQAAKIVDGFVRIGSEKTGYTDSAPEESIVCKLNIVDGTFSDAIIIDHQQYKKCPYHPNTGALLEGKIPNWETVKEVVLEVSNYISHVKYMGFDIVITDDSLKIIEINSHQGIGFNQIYKPYLQDELTRPFFLSLLEHKKQELAFKNCTTLGGKLLFFLINMKNRLKSLINW